MMRRRGMLLALLALLAIVVAAVPTVFAAPGGPTAGQRIDLKVLVIAPSLDEAGYLAWKDTLGKLGVPYDTYIPGQSAPLSDATLADYASNRAKYEGIILTSGGVAPSPAERAALDKLETSFGIREISDNTNPDTTHGASTFLGGGVTPLVPNLTGTLTDAGKAVFPYLKGPVPLGGPSYAASGIPGPSFTSLVTAPGGGSYMGVWKRANGTEQLVDGIPGNGQQSHFQLLRYGLVNWVTRGVYLGYWRNYFELQVDDLFLGDDAWNPATHANNYDPLAASRMAPADVSKALAWSQANHFRFDFAFNAGGHDQYLADGHASDPLWDAFSGPANAANRSGFGFINHTYDHAFLGCSTAPFISAEISKNVAAGQALGLPLNPAELVTGEHSGLANTKPGNPGVLDPPSFDEVNITAGGALPPGTYYYATTVRNALGETTSPAPVGPFVTTVAGSVTATVSMVCTATTYSLYRGTSATGPWQLVAQQPSAANAATDNGTIENSVTLIDNVAAGTPTTLPTADKAVMLPYAMNPNFTTGLANAGVAITATDASKSYPIETNPTVPAAVNAPQNPAGSAFPLPAPGGKVITTVPRYPTNVYYNASQQGQELDEYNWIYNATKGCIPIPGVTTCNTADVTWDQFLASERSIVFGHITGNDPKPHYAHQSNFADFKANLGPTDPNQGGILYPYLDNILGYYHGLYADNTPIAQLTSTDISGALARQQAWVAAVAAGTVSGYFQDNQVHVVTTTPIQAPVTGTIGDDYAGTKSAWILAQPGDNVLNVRTGIIVPATAAAATRAKTTLRPVLSNLKMSTRKFAAARTGLAKRKSRTQISWKLSRVATVKLVIQRMKVTAPKKKAGKRKKTTWQNVGTITKKNAKAGTTKLTFTGKVGSHKLAKGSYRLVATATAGNLKSAVRTLRFTVVKL